MSVLETGGISRRHVLGSLAGAGMGLAGLAAVETPQVPPRKAGQKSVLGLKHPAMSMVRVGVVGVGSRGMSLLKHLLGLEKVQVTAVCDIVPERAQAAIDLVVKRGQKEPAGFTNGERDFENLCKREDVDIVYIATPWDWHVPMAVCAMKNGKHAALEVPAAITIPECWELVDTTEQTRRHCIMLENCCYGEMELLALNMVRAGVLGRLTHAEGAYLHYSSKNYFRETPGGIPWRRKFRRKLDGNLYPTHGLGPIARCMEINRGDRFDRLVSMSSLEQKLSGMRDELPADNPGRREVIACGDMNTTLIKTARGRSIVVQYDTVTPRPYSRGTLLSGPKGTFGDYPPRIFIEGKTKDREWDTDLTSYQEKYGDPLWKKLRETAVKAGGHGGMDYIMNWRLMQCLLEGMELDMSVYDAVAWSCIFPLSIASVAQGSAPVAVPDFTRGEWK